MAYRKIQGVLAQMQKNLECSICLEMMKNPVSTACGHQFCRFCIMEFLERKKQVPCPLCKKPLTKRGLMEREQLGEMVLNVHKLIEAYQTDTGTLFSPPRGASVTIQPSTPECIKAKASKAGTGRPSNTRQSGHTKSNKRRISKETRRLQMDIRPKGTAARSEDTGLENLPELNIHDGLNDINRGDDSNKGSEEEKSVQNSNVQELLNMIETGSHGAFENQAVRENDKKTRARGSEHSQKLNANKVSHKITRDHHMDTAVRTNTESTEGEKQKELNSKVINEDIRQSGISISSQGSSEDIISLFRTPVNVKQLKQKQTKVHNECVINARSLRSAKTKVDNDDKDITNGDIGVPKQDFDDKTDFYDSRPENIKTYSKKKVMGKDSRSKVSDWLKNLPDNKCETREILHEKASYSVERSLKSSKRTMKKVSKGQKEVEVTGKRMAAFVGMVNKNCKDSMFGFGELDVKENIQEETVGQNYQTDMTIDEVAATNEVSILNQRNQDLTLCEKEKKENQTGKPVQRKRIFKSKQVITNRDTKCNKDTEPKGDAICSMHTEDKNSNLITTENASKPEVQKDLTSSTKSKTDNSENKLDQLESNISDREKGNSFINECEENVIGCIDDVSINERTSKNNCVSQQLKVEKDKPERLLKMVYSPMDTSQSCGDPYEFRSSQKTPKKQLKGKRCTSNKYKVRNNKGRVVKVTGKPGPRKKSVSRMSEYTDTEKAGAQKRSVINLETGMGDKLKSTDVINGEKINKDIDGTEIQMIAAEIDKAEEYDLLTSTQEALTKMTDNGVPVTVLLKENSSQNRCNKKIVRFREPVLSDFISPRKIDVRKSCEKKAVENKEKEQSMSFDNETGCSGIHEYNNKIEKKLCDRKTTNVTSIKEIKKGSHAAKEEATMKELPRKEDEDSDDLSEDYRFHDNSSGTDDLDINPDQHEFEQPDLEKQPENVKALLSQNMECNDPKFASTSCTPNLSSLSDTPQVLNAPHFKSTSAKILKETMITQIGVVKETPLIVSNVADTPQVLFGPYTTGNLHRKMKEARVQSASMSKEIELDANLQVDTEYCNENPVKVNGLDSKEKPSLVGCGNDKEVGTSKETLSSYTLETESDTDLQANINTVSENPVKVNQNCCKEKPKIHGHDEAVINGKKLNLQNFDTDTLEEKEYGSTASIFTADKDQKDTGKASDDLSCETFIATKVTSADIEVTMDTDETQTPGNFDIEDEIEDDEAVICEGEIYTMESTQSQSDDQDVTRTTVDSQTSVSVLEPKHSSTEKTVDNLNEADKEPKEAEVDSDIVEASTDSDKLKIVKKKRKCFMLEDTQDEIEADLDKCLPGDITPKRQKTDLQLDTKEQLSVNENGLSMHAEQLEEGLSKTNAKTMESFYNEKKGITGAADTAADLDVISQSTSEVENSFERERHLSGILISPNDTFHKSPENIFSTDAGMPTVDFSPEEETQCEEDSLSLLDNPGISDTEKTHVSDTQISVLQQSTPESCKRDRQNSKVRAARGFSKRVKNSSGNSVPIVRTTEVLKVESNKLRTSPGFGKGVSPVKTITNNNRQKDSYRVVSPASHCSLTTPSKANILKYRSPVASIKPLGQGTNSPMVSPSASSCRNVSKYSPGLHRTPKSTQSTFDRNMLVGNTVEVVEVTRKDVKEVEILGDDTDMRTKDTCRKVHTKGEMRNNHSYNNDKSFDKKINCSSINATETVFIDIKKDLNNYKDCPMSKESIATKRSPKLQLHLGSQERQKMVEEIPTNRDKKCLTPPNITDQQRESCKELKESKLLLDESKCTNEESKYSNSDNTGEAGNMIDSENSYDQIYEEVETDRNKKNEFESESNPLDNDVDKEGEELASSPYLVIEDGVIKNFTCPKNSTKTADKVCDKQSGLSFLSSGKADNMYTGLDLSSEESDCSDVDIDGELCEQTKICSKVNVGMNGKEAEVIEESDLDEDLDEDQRELEGEQDEIRTVKRLRPKRAILSDSDNTSEDESLHLDCTSSSAFSSQSENLTTQEREKLEKDLEKMAAEMALLKEQLEKNQDGNDAKNGVVMLDDDEEEMIHMDDSDKEMVEESCLSPPPFSPDMLSQEKSRDCVLQQDSATEDIGSDNKKADSNYTENAPVSDSDSKENVPIRKPLTDLDVNVIRKKTNQDLEPDTPAFSKKRSGFVATGLSSFQVMEVKKMASVRDIQFYSKMTHSVSHVIVKSDENDDRMCDRTLKFFQGIARKCWLVNYQWILDSKEAGYLLPETAYEIQGDTTTGYIHEGPKRSRLSKGNLFNGIKFALFGENQYLNKDSITELIKDCGGETVDQKQLEKLGENNYVICCLDLDEERNKQKKQVIARSEELRSRCGVVTLKRDWIMDSITTYKLQPIKLYTISSELD